MAVNNVLKDKNSNILNPKIPRYEKKIIWTNTDDTTSFPAKTIALADDKYTFYEIIWRVSTTANNYLTTGKIPKGRGCQLVCLSSGVGDPLRVRSVNYISSAQLNFRDAYKGSSATTTTATDICIPSVIYAYYD